MPFRKPSCLASPDYSDEKHNRRQSEQELELVPTRAEDIPDDEKGICFVNLIKKEGTGMGLTLSGGADREGRPRVSNLRSSGLAAKSDQLQVGDYITAVNGIRTTRLKHGEIISLLKNVGEKVTLEIEYHLPPTIVQTSNIVQKSTNISLKKEELSFGFVLRGGGHEQHRKSRPLVVTHIRPDSPADTEGSLKTGDRIIAIDGTPTASLCLEEANRMIAKCGDRAVFSIEYDVSVMDAVKNATGPLLVEVSKTPGIELGITLTKSTHRKKPVLCIDRVKPASIADRCGALHIGDQILSIDNVSADNGGMSVREATEMLHSASDQIKIEILPVSHLAVTASKQYGQNRFAPVITGAQSMTALNPHRPGSSRLPSSGHISTLGRGSNRWNRRRLPPRTKYSSSATNSGITRSAELASDSLNQSVPENSMSLVSTDYFSGNQVVHAEVQEVLLLTSNDGCDLVTSSSSLPNFGIQLQGGVFATEVLNPLISYIEPDRAADRSGLLQSGDRLLSINGYSCEQCTVDEIEQMLADSYYAGRALLEVEFDVAESVVPSSGTFHAKIPKRRGVDVGIVIAVAGGQQTSALMISEVRKGSAAHRTGTLEAGDRILSIDGVGMNDCSLDDARALLASAEDVVRLKIQKDEENNDDVGNDTVSYTVELKRHGGPLGITISGTEEPFDPIFISGLTPGGLAARTGAIREGDKMQSINNIPLRAKPLSEAIALLQGAGEVVTLKIRRHLSTDPDPSSKKSNSSAPTGRSSFHPTNPYAGNPLLNETAPELSDPEDDILPPPMGPISDRAPTPEPSSTPKSHTPVMASTLNVQERGYRPGPAGAASVDSAVESWEDSSAETQQTRSSVGSRRHTSMSPIYRDADNERGGQHSTRKKSSGHVQVHSNPRSSVGKLRAKFEAPASRSYSDTWGTREQMRARTIRSPEQSSQPAAEWQRALDDLQSVGQSSDYIKDLETKLTVEGDDDKWPVSRQQSTPNDEYGVCRSPLGGGLETLSSVQRKMFMKAQQPHRIKLYKDNPSEDFGFSMSDGQMESGVYVHTVKPGSPASRAGLLPYDRVLQVNDVSTHDVDCTMVIALVAPSQTQLELLITRYPRGGALSPYAQPHSRPVLSPPVCLPGTKDQAFDSHSKW